MPTYGDKQEPGITTDIASAYNVSTSGDAPSDLGIVGQADLTTGTASANELHEVTRASQARTLFGDETESLLTAGVIDALAEGAFPVFAVATEEVETTGEDISGIGGTSFTLTNTPCSENADDYTVTVDGTNKTVKITYQDPSSDVTVDTDECYINPVTGDGEVDAAPSDADDTNDTVDYTYYDYTSAIDVMESEGAEEVDFLVSVNENSTVADHVVTTAETMDDNYDFALALPAAGINVDPGSYTQNRDTSRAQEVYGTRFEDGTSMLAAYAGKRAALGLDRPAINVRLESDKRMMDHQADALDVSGRSSLIDERVVPIADESGGCRIVDSPTTVDPTGTKEDRNINYGFSRLLVDYVTDTTRENEQPFIGRLNSSAVRNTFRDLVQNELSELQSSNSISSFTINVEQVDATTASLELSVEIVEPLRFIENGITVGESA